MAKKKSPTCSAAACPCGSGKTLDQCCGPIMDGSRRAADAVELMRSRYTAYVLGNDIWLRRSWAPENCPTTILEPGIVWLGLRVLADACLDQTHATVEFVARGRYKNTGAFRMHEVSRFEKREQGWIYVDGDVDDGNTNNNAR